MIKNSIAYIANRLWMLSLKNMTVQIGQQDMKRFSNQDYYYLTTIYYMDGPNFSEVAERLQLTKPAISAIVTKLTSMGLVEKVQSREDKRIYHLYLSEKGLKIMEGDEAMYAGIETIIKNSVNDENDYQKIQGLLEIIAGELKKF